MIADAGRVLEAIPAELWLPADAVLTRVEPPERRKQWSARACEKGHRPTAGGPTHIVITLAQISALSARC